MNAKSTRTTKSTKALTAKDVAANLLAEVTTRATDLAHHLTDTGETGESLREAIERAKDDARLIAEAHGVKSWVGPLVAALAASEISTLEGPGRRMAAGLLAEYGVPTIALAKVFGISQPTASRLAKAAREMGEAGEVLAIMGADGVEQKAKSPSASSNVEGGREPTAYALAKQTAKRLDVVAARAIATVGTVLKGEVDLTALKADQRAEAIAHAEEMAAAAIAYVEALKAADLAVHEAEAAEEPKAA